MCSRGYHVVLSDAWGVVANLLHFAGNFHDDLRSGPETTFETTT